MFATLHGGLPVPPPDPDATDPVTSVVRAQASAGLDPVTDGDRSGDPFDLAAAALGPSRPRWERPILVDAWARAAEIAGALDPPRSVKASVPGPYSLARAMAPRHETAAALVQPLAEALNQEILALQAAGCPIVQVDEPALARVGDDASERGRFTEAQRRLLDGVGIHAMLAVVGGSAHLAGATTVFEAPYASILVDLISGPDNWKLVRQAPADRGIVCAAMPIEPDRSIDLPMLVWAAEYAASANGRGLARVGLATAGSLADLPWEEADRRIRRLVDAAELAAADPETRARRLDPRALARPRRTLGPATPTPPLDSRGRPPRPLPGARPDEGGDG